MRQSAEAGGAVPALDGAALVRLAPGLAAVGPVTVEDWGRFPAPHLGLDRLWALRNRVAEVAASGAVRGIVVTHGTDTLEETAYMLARTLEPTIPVVLTGAMRTSEEEEWDGRRNLVDSARVTDWARAPRATSSDASAATTPTPAQRAAVHADAPPDHSLERWLLLLVAILLGVEWLLRRSTASARTRRSSPTLASQEAA